MGVVYAARHRVLGRPAAIKLLLANTIQHRDRVERFFNEARAAMAISHPGIVEVYDVGVATDERAYIAMELLAGASLTSRLERGPLPLRVAIDYARQIADALGAAHAVGVIHRDLKPDNLIVLADHRIKIVDFGIAKLAEPLNVRTATGALIGTPAYMSPEQCEGLREVDARTDLYSLGCVMFQMLTGRPPFEGGGTGGLIAAQLQTPPPPLRSRCPAASVELESVVQTLLAKSRDARFGSARALLAALANPAVEVICGPVGVAVTADPASPPHRAAPAITPPAPSAVAASGYGPTALDTSAPTHVRSHPAATRRRALAILATSCAATAIIAILATRSCSDGATPPRDAAIAIAPREPSAPLDPPREPSVAAVRDLLRDDEPAPPPVQIKRPPQPRPPQPVAARPRDAGSAPPPEAPERPQPEPVPDVDLRVGFAPGAATLAAEPPELAAIARAMIAHADLRLQITGHAEHGEAGGGSDTGFAEARGHAVKQRLVARGVAANRIVVLTWLGSADGTHRHARVQWVRGGPRAN
jgi:hypothetical protein